MDICIYVLNKLPLYALVDMSEEISGLHFCIEGGKITGFEQLGN